MIQKKTQLSLKERDLDFRYQRQRENSKLVGGKEYTPWGFRGGEEVLGSDIQEWQKTCKRLGSKTWPWVHSRVSKGYPVLEKGTKIYIYQPEEVARVQIFRALSGKSYPREPEAQVLHIRQECKKLLHGVKSSRSRKKLLRRALFKSREHEIKITTVLLLKVNSWQKIPITWRNKSPLRRLGKCDKQENWPPKCK